jgi:hypothetical protein
MNNDPVPPTIDGLPPQPPKPRRSALARLGSVLVVGFVILLVLVVIAVVFENWRGRRAWSAFKSEQEAAGESFEIKDFIPEPVPAEQNFAMTPFLAPLLDYVPGPTRWNDPDGRERANELGSILKSEGELKAPAPGNWEAGVFINLDHWGAFFAAKPNAAPSERSTPETAVLAALSQWDPVLEELRTASSRPHSVFPIHYEENFNALLPHLATLKTISQIVRLRALARLAAGRKDEAMQDVMLGVRLGEALRTEPLLISQLVRIAILHLTLQPVWEGLARRDWNDAQMRDLQNALAGVQLLPDYGRAMRGERAFSNDLFERMRTGQMNRGQSVDLGGSALEPEVTRFLPSGWFYHNQTMLNRLHQQYTLPVIDASLRRVYPDKALLAEHIPELQKFSPYNLFARMLLPAVAKSSAKFAKVQTSLDLATIACALERFRLARGSYPDQLEALVPQFITALPHDLVSGEALHYSRTDDGRFLVYSIGWNLSDDGGEPWLRKSGDTDPNQGDWSWSYLVR